MITKRKLCARLLSLAACLVGFGQPAEAQFLSSGLLNAQSLARNGFTRAWHTVVPIDSTRNRIRFVELQGDVLYIQTSSALLHAISASTGETLWSTQIGRPDWPLTMVAADQDMVALLSGSRLHIASSLDGTMIWQRDLDGVMDLAPGLSSELVYVPTRQQEIHAFSLTDPTRYAWTYSTLGKPTTPPLVTSLSVSWASDSQRMLITRPDLQGTAFDVQLTAPVVSPLAYRYPAIYAASLDGYVYAIDEQTGERRWRYSAGDPIYSSPVPIEDSVYVVTDVRDLFSIHLEEGTEQWQVPGVKKVVSVSPEPDGLVFVEDSLGRLTMLEKANGQPRGRFAIPPQPVTYVTNTVSDRVYLVSERGLVQCLHESRVSQPASYVVEPPAAVLEGAASPSDVQDPEGQPSP